MTELDRKLAALRHILTEMGSVLVAFSGGGDSALPRLSGRKDKR